jgi:xanthosine utilization system XapX-like protein
MSNITVTAGDVKKQGDGIVGASSFMLGIAYILWSFDRPVTGILIGIIGALGWYVGLKMVLTAQDAVQKAADKG